MSVGLSMLRRLGVAKENDRLPYLRKMFHFGLLRRFLEDEGTGSREQGEEYGWIKSQR